MNRGKYKCLDKWYCDDWVKKFDPDHKPFSLFSG